MGDGETLIDQVERRSRTEQLVVWAAGGDESLLAQCPSERKRFIGMGTMNLVTGVMAMAACAIAVATIQDGDGGEGVAVAVGAVWGIIILFLNRFITSLPVNPVMIDPLTGAPGAAGSWRSRIGAQAMTAATVGIRVVLAVAISWLVSKPMELQVFAGEIDQHLGAVRSDRLQSGLEEIDADYAAASAALDVTEEELVAADPEAVELRDQLMVLDEELATAQQEAADLGVELRSERTGVGLDGRTSGQAGDGPVADAISAQLELAENEVTSLEDRREALSSQLASIETTDEDAAGRTGDRLDEIAAERSRLAEQRDADIEQLQIDVADLDGLLIRADALEWLSYHDLGDPLDSEGSRNLTWWISHALTLVIFTIELLPAIAKIGFSFGASRPYDTIDALRRHHEILTGQVTYAPPAPKTQAAHTQPLGMSQQSAAEAEPGPVAIAATTDPEPPPAQKVTRRRSKYSDAQKRDLVSRVHALVATGLSETAAIQQVAEETDPAAETLRGWVRRLGGPSTSGPRQRNGHPVSPQPTWVSG
jgi:transposase-like protein